MIKQIQRTETGKMSILMTSFEEILNYFKLRNGWLNSKVCAKRKLWHSDENAYVFLVKKETLKLVSSYEIRFIGKLCTLIFLLLVDIFITALPRSYSRARKLCFSVISANYYTNYKHSVWLFGSKKGNIDF